MRDVDDDGAGKLFLDIGTDDVPDLPGDITVERAEAACFFLGRNRFNLECLSCDVHINMMCLRLTVSDMVADNLCWEMSEEVRSLLYKLKDYLTCSMQIYVCCNWLTGKTDRASR